MLSLYDAAVSRRRRRRDVPGWVVDLAFVLGGLVAFGAALAVLLVLMPTFI